MGEEKYDESSIIKLTEVEHIRANPSMYIGATETPKHLLYEALDNALDEATAGYADLVLVAIDNKNGIYTVADNGRGIPFKDGKLVQIATQMFCGGKFKKGENSTSYKIASGLHGIGLLAVTALSEWCEITVYRDNKKVFYRFVDCKVADSKIEDFNQKTPCSTLIRFKPDKQYFEKIYIDPDTIKVRLQLASANIENLRLIYSVDGEKSVIKMTMDEFFNTNFYSNSDKKEHTKIFTVQEKVKDEELKIMFGWDMNTYSQPIAGGSVNLLVVNRGTHINMTYIAFQNVFAKIAKKEKLNFNLTDCKIGLRVFTLTQLYDAHYVGQTKEELCNSKDKLKHLYEKIEKKIEDCLRENEELFNKIVFFVDSYRKSLTAKKAIVKNESGKLSRYNSQLDSNLRNCTSSDVEKCELHICEGSSAAGTILQARNPKYQAVFGLRGKVPNLADGKVDFLKNKEYVELINAIGAGFGKDFDINKISYGRIIISCDADADGCVDKNHFIYLRKNKCCIKAMLKDVIDNPNDFYTYEVLTYNTVKCIYEYCEIQKIYPYRKSKKSIRITMEDDSVINVTPDHLILTKNRGYVSACELKETDEIENFYEGPDQKRNNIVIE